MPTGLTEIIDNNPETTFREFALRCARGIGVCARMRDEPLDVPPPNVVKPDTYHRDALAKAEAALARLEALGAGEVEQHCTAANCTALAQYREASIQDDVRGRYLAMLAQVKEWKAPTSSHEDFKNMMVRQLTDGGGLNYDHSRPVPKMMTPEEWYETALSRARYDVNYHSTHWAQEQERCAEASAWLQALYASLPEE